MQIYEKDGGVLVKSANFNAAQTFLCGQCFRFDRDGDGFVGVVGGKVLRVKDTDGGVFFQNMTASEFESKYVAYFDLERDYSALVSTFPKDDIHLALAAKECGGIRILNQDPWEALISFIISQNNNIPRIKGVISRMCRLFGENIEEEFYSFPTPERLASCGEEELAALRCGYRAPYISECAAAVASGKIDLDGIKKMPYDDARRTLLGIKGVGPKVADCALLFGFGFTEAFPVDTWVKKVMRERYGESFDIKTFGKYAGLAQQYLFYYERGTRE